MSLTDLLYRFRHGIGFGVIVSAYVIGTQTPHLPGRIYRSLTQREIPLAQNTSAADFISKKTENNKGQIENWLYNLETNQALYPLLSDNLPPNDIIINGFKERYKAMSEDEKKEMKQSLDTMLNSNQTLLESSQTPPQHNPHTNHMLYALSGLALASASAYGLRKKNL